jgi:hypothetical protein
MTLIRTLLVHSLCTVAAAVRPVPGAPCRPRATPVKVLNGLGLATVR